MDIIEDSLVEGPEVFAIRMTLDPLPPRVVLINDSANVTIMDNDGKCIKVYKAGCHKTIFTLKNIPRIVYL